MKDFLSGAIIFLLGSLAGGFLFSSEKEVVKTVTEIEERVDTVVIEKPAETRYETLRETILVEVRDTVTERDTLFVRLPLEKREYRRDDFYAEVTGVEPRLTYIEVYPKTQIVKVTERVMPKNELSFGFDVGYTGRFYTPIYFQYSRMLHKNIDFNAKVVYDLTCRSYGAEVGLEFGFGW